MTCRAHNRSGKRCGRAPIPFGDLCTNHGGLSASELARAEAAFQRYVSLGPGYWEPPWQRAYNQRRWAEFQARLAARHERKQRARHPDVNFGDQLVKRRRKLTSTEPGTASAPISYWDW